MFFKIFHKFLREQFMDLDEENQAVSMSLCFYVHVESNRDRNRGVASFVNLFWKCC